MSDKRQSVEPTVAGRLPSALERAEEWSSEWRKAGQFVLLLDFDGTLAPIVERPELARIPEATRRAIQRLMADGVQVAIVSGRGLADARDLAGLGDSIAYAGNHGMEIEMPGLQRVHPEAAAARTNLDQVASLTEQQLSGLQGLLVEDKGLTLSIHYRQVQRQDVERVRSTVTDLVTGFDNLRLTEGKEVLEVRPDVDWHKGRAVEFLLGQIEPAPRAPILYIGDDRTDEDAFVALRQAGLGEGVLVSDDPDQPTRALSTLKSTEEVARLLDLLHRRGN